MIDPIGLIGTLIAIVQVSSKVVSICYEYRRSVKNAPREISQILDEVASLRNLVERLVNILESNEQSASLPSLQAMAQDSAPLMVCLSEMEALKSLLKPRKGWKARGMALIWPLKQNETKEHLEVIGRMKGTLQLAISADNAANLVEILALSQRLPMIHDTVSTLTSEIDRMGEETRYRQIIDWLAAPDLSQKHQNEWQRHVPNSGQWLLQHEAYQAWQRSSNATLWLHGFCINLPGCGKTVLCAAIIEDLRKRYVMGPNTAIFYIYFDANGGHKYNTALILRTLITQLLHQTGMVPANLLELYRTWDSLSPGSARAGPKHGPRKLNPTSEDFEGILQHQIDELQHAFVVFDALDECGDLQVIQDVLYIIRRISTRSFGQVNLLATSRYLPEIEDCFEEIGASSLAMKINCIDEDIRKYIQFKFREDLKLSSWPKDIRAETEAELMAQAQGMFRWADCQMQALKKCRTPSAIRKTLQTLPKTLNETYTRILLDIDEADVTFAQKLLQWLAISMRPLLLTEINEALAIDMDSQDQPYYDPSLKCLDMRDIVSVCSSLITTSGESNARIQVRLAHSSVKEFLMSLSTQSDACARFAVTQDLAHARLAKSCIAYLIRLDTPLRNKDLEELSFVDYAAKHWMLHAGNSNMNLDSGPLEGLIWEIFDPEKACYRNWTHLNNIDAPWRRSDLSNDMPNVPSLYAAAFLGLGTVCRRLIQDGVDVNAPGGLLGNALQAAAFRHHIGIVQMLLDANADLNARGGIWRTPMCAAASQGDTDMVALLLKYGMKPQRSFSVIERGAPLFIAAKEGHIECCRMLLDHGAQDYWSPKEYPGSALHVATLAGHKEIVKLLLSEKPASQQPGYVRPIFQKERPARTLQGPDIWKELLSYGVPDDIALEYSARIGDEAKVATLLPRKVSRKPSETMWDHQLVLESAARGGHTAIVRDLLSRKVDPNMDSDYHDILCAAVISGDVESIEMLIAAGADVNNSSYDRPLSAAVRHGNSRAVRILVQHGADLNADGYSAIFAATNTGRLDMIKLLMDLGAELPLEHPESTRLMGAVAYGGSARIVQFFFEQGVNPKKDGEEDEQDQTFDPIFNALKEKRSDIVLALLDGGMNVNRIIQSSTPLSKAIDLGDDLLAARLLRYGADVNLQKSEEGPTPLLNAVNHGMISIIKLLLEREADPNRHGTINRNQLMFPLLLAAGKGYMDIGRLLIAHGALVDRQDANGFSALHGAAGHSQDAFVEMLITEYSADYSARLFNGSMPIHSAASRGNPKSIKILLKVGGDINVENHDGRTPLHWASEKCQWDNVQFLLDNGARTDIKADGEMALTPLDLAHLGLERTAKERYTASAQHKAWSEKELDELFKRLGESLE